LCADVFTTNRELFWVQHKSGTIKIKEKKISSENTIVTTNHNHTKQRLVGEWNKTYLHDLGIANETGKILADKQFKYKQINRFVEIFADVFSSMSFDGAITMLDMGCGKGYLTFAVAEYFMLQKSNAQVVGVEMRPELVALCNTITKKNSLSNLNFKEGTIQDFSIPKAEIIMALHACDTATDDAIQKGIESNASLIICAPCCHKEIRKKLKTNLTSITKHGILLERQAEIVTDSLRALWLEMHGYKTRVIDFVDVNDTPKNVMIIAQKVPRSEKQLAEYKQQFAELKNAFGLEGLYLEK
jgi:SAM-dependent methyltransferase